MANIEMSYLNPTSRQYEALYPKVNLSNTTGILPVESGGTGTNSLATLASNMGTARLQTGSYVGTDTYGASNPCSLTFDLTPRFIWIEGKNYKIKKPDGTYDNFWTNYIATEGHVSNESGGGAITTPYCNLLNLNNTYTPINFGIVTVKGFYSYGDYSFQVNHTYGKLESKTFYWYTSYNDVNAHINQFNDGGNIYRYSCIIYN